MVPTTDLPGGRQRRPKPGRLRPIRRQKICACIDRSSVASKIISHAIALASALKADITLVRVIEAKPAGDVLPDPVEWEILRRQAQDDVERLARHYGGKATVKVEVAVGNAAEQICQWSIERNVDITVVGTHGESGAIESGLGNTARKVLERVNGSILLVPAVALETTGVHYRKILVPLDGSSRAEVALPLAVRIASSEGAETVLAHVVPVPELTETGPLEAEDIELRDRLVSRNERVASTYLDRARSQLVAEGIAAYVLMLRNGDVRSRLTHAVLDEAIDLVVLSAHGRSGRADVSLGSTAVHLLEHTAAPVLIVRDRPAETVHRWGRRATTADVRLPEQAVP